MAKERKNESSDSNKAGDDSICDAPARKEYLEHRRTLVEGEQKAYESYDKYLLTLSAGALGVSVNLVRVFDLTGKSRCCLICGASFICLSLVLILISFLFSQRAWRRERDILDISYERRNETPRNERNLYSGLTFWFNVASTVAFVGGAILVIIAVAISS